MVFKQIGTEVSFLSKSFKDIKKDFSSGLGIKQSLFSFISQNDIKALNDFEKAIRNSSMTYKQAFDTYLSKAPIAIKRQANEIIKLTNQQRVLNAQRQAGKITEEQYNTAMTANKAKMQALTTQTQSLTLSQKAATVASKGLSIAMNLLGNIAIMGIITLISKGVKALSDLANHIEITREKVDDLRSTFKSALDTANSNAKRVEELADRYDELSDGVNNLGENVSLTNEEYEEYNTLVNEIADMFPTLVQGYTDEGNAILNLKGNVEALRNAYKEAQQEAYNLLIANGQDSDGNDIIKQWNNLYDTGFWASEFDLGASDVGKSISVTNAIEQLKAIQNISAERYRELKRIAGSGTKEEISTLSDIEKEIAYGNYLGKALGLTSDFSNEDFQNAKKQAKILVQTYNAEVESALADVKTLANAYLMTNEDYDKLDDQSKNIVSILTNSLDFDIANGFKSKEDVGDYVEDILTKLKESEPEIQSAFNELLSLDTENLSLSEAKKQVDNSIQKLSSYLDIDENQLKISFGFEFVDDNFDELQNVLNRAKEKFDLKLDWTNVVESEHGVNTKEEIALLAECIDATDSMTKALELYDIRVAEVATTTDNTTKSLEELQEAYDELSKSASNYVGNQKTVNSALEEQKEYGQLSAKTIQDLIDAGYAQALVYDDVTGAMTLNRQTLELLNTLKKREIELDLQKQETDLVTIYDEERSKIAELNKELANTNSLRAQEIINELTALETTHKLTTEQLAQVRKLKESLNAPNYDSSGGGSGEEETPTEIQNFLDDYAKYHHDINMGIKKEDEDYFNWLEKAAHDAYSKYPDYEDDLWKYEEEVYKGRKQLAEDFYDEQQKLFEDRVSNLETNIEVATKYSTDADGNKLDIEEKYDYISSAYQEIINEINARIGEILDVGIEGHEEEVANLEKQIEEYQEKLSDVFKSAVEEEQDLIEKQKKAYSDLYDERIDKIKEQQKVAEEAAQAEIDAVQEKIDALKEANEKAEEANEIEKARQDLANASQRTRQVYGADGSISYQVDQEKVKEAQENLDKLLQEQQINILEEQKQALEDAKDKASESYDKIIENLETEKENGEKRFDILLDVLDRYLNPDNGESNSDVWKTLAHIEGAKYEDGTWKDKDGNVIDIDKLLETAKNEDKQTDTDNKPKDNPKDDTVISGTLTRQDIGDEEPDVKDKTESAIDTFFSNLEKKLNMPSGSINLENAMQVFKNSPMMNFNPYGAMNDRTGLANKEYVNNVNNQQNITPTFTGDIVISNPVGNSDDLAKELMMNIPIAFQKQMYSNLK